MYPSLYPQARAKWAEFCLWLRMSGGWRGFVLSSPFSTASVPGHMRWELKLPVAVVKSQVALGTFGASIHFSKETQELGQDPQGVEAPSTEVRGRQFPGTHCLQQRGWVRHLSSLNPQNRSHKPAQQARRHVSQSQRNLEVVSSLTPPKGAVLGRCSQPHGVESPIPTPHSRAFFP